jgi:hypothetical protein
MRNIYWEQASGLLLKIRNYWINPEEEVKDTDGTDFILWLQRHVLRLRKNCLNTEKM